jgi:histidinol-phosphate/aromatic aminotransferase/cobyric acid decarboxylase-like protein
MFEVSLDRLVPEYVKKFEPYIPSKPDPELMRLYGCERLYRLNNNENPLGPPPEAQEILRLRARLYEILSKHTGQPAAKIEKDCDRNLWLGAEESIAYGLADQILQKAPEVVKTRSENGNEQ